MIVSRYSEQISVVRNFLTRRLSKVAHHQPTSLPVLSGHCEGLTAVITINCYLPAVGSCPELRVHFIVPHRGRSRTACIPSGFLSVRPSVRPSVCVCSTRTGCVEMHGSAGSQTFQHAYTTLWFKEL